MRLVATALVLGSLLWARPGGAAEPEFNAKELETLDQSLKAFLTKQGTLERVYSLALGMQTEDGAAPAAKSAWAAKKLVVTARQRDGLVLTAPNLSEFESLARQAGTSADVEFFRLMHRTYPDSHVPVYRTQTGERAHCANLAPGVFVPLYGDWMKYAKAHSSKYSEAARRELNTMGQELQSAKCACGSAKTVVAALQAFVKAYPRGDVTPEVEGRLDQIRRRRPDITFDCVGGER